MKSARRNKAEGTMDKIAGRLMTLWGKVTGKPSSRVKGRAARGRGRARSARGRIRRTAR
jgi:uncharacterized protein YjbJ (UPF0337 family)